MIQIKETSPVHIETLCAKVAAQKICEVLSRANNPWLVWSVGDEGLCMAPAESRTAANVRRYWPRSVLCVYDATIDASEVVADLMVEGFGEQELPAYMPGGEVPEDTPRRRSTGRPRSRFSLHLVALDAIAANPLTVVQMAELLAVDKEKARNVIHYLMQTKRACNSRVWNKDKKRFVSTYRAAA